MTYFDSKLVLFKGSIEPDDTRLVYELKPSRGSSIIDNELLSFLNYSLARFLASRADYKGSYLR